MLSKENEQFEEDLSQTKDDLEKEKKNTRKLEKVLRDAAWAMRGALMVSYSSDKLLYYNPQSISCL